MIVLRPMRATEYPAYLDYFIPDYAAEISANYALSPAAALAQAQREWRGWRQSRPFPAFAGP